MRLGPDLVSSVSVWKTCWSERFTSLNAEPLFTPVDARKVPTHSVLTCESSFSDIMARVWISIAGSSSATSTLVGCPSPSSGAGSSSLMQAEIVVAAARQHAARRRRFRMSFLPK